MDSFPGDGNVGEVIPSTVLLSSNNILDMEFKNVVFNAARDGKLRRLKVCCANLKLSGVY